MIIKLMGPEHEYTTRAVDTWIAIRLFIMGVDAEMSAGGTTRFAPRNQLYSSHRKEANGSWKPPFLRPNRDDPPTLVIEVGNSENISSLRASARWWLASFYPSVQDVLLIDLNRATKTVKFETWKSRRPTARYSF